MIILMLMKIQQIYYNTGSIMMPVIGEVDIETNISKQEKQKK